MLRSHLIAIIAEENPHLTNAESERTVRTIFDAIADKLAEGGRVELRGFGALSVRHRKARRGRNPRSGESVQVEAKAVPYFKTGRALHDRLNGK